MCTVSFVPREDGYLLVCNRDERRSRPIAEAPRWERRGAAAVCAPRDPQGGGSWIALSAFGWSLCLLNGARGEPVEARPDAPSRGRLLMELMARADPSGVGDELRERHQAGRLVENAFRLMLATPQGLRLWEWNGRELRERRPEGLHLEVSHGLEPVAGWEARQRSFDQRRAAGIDEATLLDWHSSHLEGVGRARSPCMHHELAATVSQTCIQVDAATVSMSYRPGPPCQGREASRHEAPRKRDGNRDRDPGQRTARGPDPSKGE